MIGATLALHHCKHVRQRHPIRRHQRACEGLHEGSFRCMPGVEKSGRLYVAAHTGFGYC
jgi:hypothetical protein